MLERNRISVVTLSLNQGRYLEQAIQSLISQKYANIELILVDPGSSDGSRKIIDRYLNQITHFIDDEDDGPAQGLNRGFARATGDILGFLNADDLLLPGALRHVTRFFERNPDTDVLLGCGVWVDEAGRTIRHVVPSRFSVRMAAAGRFEFIQQSMFFRRHAFQQCGGFNEANKICWDGELLFELGKAGKRFDRTSRELGAFRVHRGTISSSAYYLERLRIEEERVYSRSIGASVICDKLQSYFWLGAKWFGDPWYFMHRLRRATLRW